MYAIYYNGSYLSNRPGWGPSFTIFVDDAKKFRSERAARAYIEKNLSGFGCDVVHVA